MARKYFVLWFLLLLLAGCTPAVAAQVQEKDDLARQVQLLNLLNGLELSPEQMGFVLEKARQAEEIRARYREQAGERRQETDAVLGEIRAVLMAGQTIPEELAARYHTVAGENEALWERFTAEMDRLAREVEGALEDHQRYTLEHYVPCIIPPPGEARVGQAPTGERAQALLERVWALSEEEFAARREAIARRIFERILERGHGRIVIVDREAELSRILGLLDRVHALSEAELLVQGPQLVEELLAPYRGSVPRTDLVTKIRQHLLDPEIISLLEERLSGQGAKR